MNKVLLLVLSCIFAYSSMNAMEQKYPLHEAAEKGS